MGHTWTRFLLSSALLALFTCVQSCGGKGSALPGASLDGGGAAEPASGLAAQASWPLALPTDHLQPWEQLTSNGYILPRSEAFAPLKAGAAINAASEFAVGVEYESAEGALSPQGEVLRLTSGLPGASAVSWAIYRLPLGGPQPGAISADVNLRWRTDDCLSTYYLGLSDYGAGRWDWRGPFGESHVRLSTGAAASQGASYTSPLGSLFVCVLAYDGAKCDVVGIGANSHDEADVEPPPAPAGLTVSGCVGAFELAWHHSAADDLAGYRVHWANQWFDSPADWYVQQEPYLAGTNRHLLPTSPHVTWLQVSAVDLSGNESAPSNLVRAVPRPGTAPELELTANPASGSWGLSVTLTANGTGFYDWDFNGDGLYDLTGDTTGSAVQQYNSPGIIRPAVRGTNVSGTKAACAAVSLIITKNTRPVASAAANPASGPAPLSVTFTGQAQDEEDDLDDLTFAWDFDGDGNYELDTDTLTPPPYTYTMPGLYNVKLRVMDLEGAWDVDTVTVQVLDPVNQPPLPQLSAAPLSGDAPLTVTFNAGLSSDPDGSIVEYAWDLDGDGMYDGITDEPEYTYTYTATGSPQVRLRVEDNDGARAVDTLTITVNVVGNELPSASLAPVASSGNAPHIVNFDASGSFDPDGSIVLYEWDFDSDGNYDGYGADSTINHAYALPGAYTATLRVTDNVGAQDSATASINVNALPEASLTATPPEGNKGVTVRLDAGGSSDADGSITDYEWDLDGDGSFNELGEEADNQGASILELAYPTPGHYFITVRITDDASPAGTDTASATVTVHGWVTLTVDSSTDVGYYTSLAVVDGCPAISYYDNDQGNLKYARASTSTGGSAADWSQVVTIDGDDNVGAWTSMTVVDGCPGISYMDITNLNLKYARATTTTGSSAADWTQIITVDNEDDTGRYTSIAIVDGCPAIAYTDHGDADLMYARATTSTGANSTDWSQIVVVDSTGVVGQYPSLAVVDGCPAISYTDELNDDLKYARATTSTGGASGDWTQIVIVDSATVTGFYTSLAVVDGHPAISYFDHSPDDLRYVRATTSTGSTSSVWTQFTTVDSANSVGWYSSMAVIGGRPAISYYYVSDADLKFAWATTSTGGGLGDWSQVVTVDQTGFVGMYPSLAEVAGCPAISYFDDSSNNLKYAICY